MNITISNAISRLSPSLTLVLAAKTAEMRKAGKDVCSFTAGEPDFDTPESIRRKTCDAIMKGGQICQYTGSAGLPELRSAIAERFRRDNGLTYDPNNIIVCTGAKQVLVNAIFSLVNPGDRVLIPAPYWLSYPEMVMAAGGEPVFLDCRNNPQGAPTGAQIRAEIAKGRVKALILNSPNNPTGGVYSKQQYQDMYAAMAGTDVVVLSDEMYEYFVYDGAKHVSPATISADAYARTLTITGLSKSHAMTGWRVGFAGGDLKLIKAMTALQSHSTSNTATVSQYAAMFALEEGTAFAEHVRGIFTERRKLIIDGLSKIPGTSIEKPDGAFYAWLRVDSLYGKQGKSASGGTYAVNNSMDFCTHLLEQEAVSCVPGSAFGADSHIRLSYAASLETIAKGVERLGRFVNGLK
jgi:aspartate aminotransferase